MAHPNPAETAFERMKLLTVRQVSNTQVYQLSYPDLQGLQSSIYTSKLNNAREQCQHCHIVKRISGVFSALDSAERFLGAILLLTQARDHSQLTACTWPSALEAKGV